jgi:signal transduction histidine kinase/CheY-like chemotaxis protein/HAMP domain-containing protein
MLEALKFSHRILLLVALAAMALTTVTATAVILGRRGVREVSGIETRYLPLLELNGNLQSLFDRVAHTLEDAASAADESDLSEADQLRDEFLAALAAGKDHIAANGADPRDLAREFVVYYRRARALSSEIISGHIGEDLADSVEEMQSSQQRVSQLLDAGTTPDRARIAEAFESARAAHGAAVLIDLMVASAALALMLALSWWIVRGAVRSLRSVSRGVERLARGDFSQEIRVAARDEFGELAREANRTAVRLREYREQAEQEDWVKTGSGGLTSEIAGELTSLELGRRALVYLARYVEAVTGAVYAADEQGQLQRLETYGFEPDPAAPSAFRPGQGVVGQAANDSEVRLLDEVPPAHRTARWSPDLPPPRHLLVVPFRHEDRCMGVLEFGFAEPPPPPVLELMRRTRHALSIGLRVAESRQRVASLVDEMQQQAEELRTAYDSLQAQNEALVRSEQQLQAQQEELHVSNEELERQATTLEAQRSALVVKNEELLRAQETIEQKASELARASKYKSEFLANMSHELRTPLNSIMILAKILASNDDGALGAKQVEFANVIHKSGDELLTLINDILDLTKIEAGKQELVYGPMTPSEAADYVRQMFAPLAVQKGLAFEVDLAPGLPPEFRTDRMRLEQILKNLLSNAIKFTERGRIDVRIAKPPEGHKLLAAAPDEEAIAFAVTDTGVGIAPDKQQIVFEAFAQADGGTSRKFGGTGLGLAIARQLAFRLGGEIQLESEPGVGSTFVFYLPTREPRRRPASTPAPPAPVLTASRRADTEPRIHVDDDRDGLEPGEPCFLVIEDDPDFAGSLVDLIRQSGFRALAATGGRQGLELAARFRPSGIILDVGLPDLDGWGVMERLQASRVTREIPVHFLTAGSDAQRARQMGAVGFLSKPVDPQKIRAAIRTLERSIGAASSVLVVEHDPAMRETLREVLSRVGARIETAASDEDALVRLEADHFGVMVLDLALPDKKTGLALLERIRAESRLVAMPVIVHTGLALSDDEARDLARAAETIVVLEGERSVQRILEETRLFLHRIRSELPARRRRLVDLVHGGETVLDGKRVLIVDDDMRNLYSLTNALETKRLQIIAATDGQEALEQLERHADTDIVLMDIMMPRMDGHEAIRRIRRQTRFDKLPIIALTARTMPGERQKCIDAGANDYIPKPVDVDRLLSLLRVWLTPP